MGKKEKKNNSTKKEAAHDSLRAGMAAPDLSCHWSAQLSPVPNDEVEGNGLNWAL